MEERKKKSHLTQTLARKRRQKVMSTSIAARMLQLLGLPALLYQPGVRTNLEVTVLYAQVKVKVLPVVTVHLARDPRGSKPDFYRVRLSLLL